jgi:hypothetical protein
MVLLAQSEVTALSFPIQGHGNRNYTLWTTLATQVDVTQQETVAGLAKVLEDDPSHDVQHDTQHNKSVALHLTIWTHLMKERNHQTSLLCETEQ